MTTNPELNSTPKQELGPNQKKVVEALRSGKYKQGRAFLCFIDLYCCLGIMNEILELDESDDYYLRNTYEKIGLYSHKGELKQSFRDDNDNIFSSLSAMNDYGWNFNQIADYIEQNPSNVFSSAI